MASRKRKASESTVEPTFEDMGLNKDLIRGIYSYGFEKPSTIQQHLIKQITKGKDLIINTTHLAHREIDIISGALQKLDTQTHETQVLVLAPSLIKTICLQKIILAIGDYMNVHCHACIGGTNVERDICKLEYGQHVVTGTPDRIVDMISGQNLRTRGIKLLVLDEADEMLSMGFKEQLYDIYPYLPPDVQFVLLSATLSRDVLEMTSKFMTDPVTVKGVLGEEPNVETFSNYLMVHAKQLKKAKSKDDVLNSFAANGTLNRTTPEDRTRHYHEKSNAGITLSRDFKMAIVSSVKVHSGFVEICQDVLQLSVALEFAIHHHFEESGCTIKTKPGIVSGSKQSSIYLFDKVSDSKASLFTGADLQKMIDYIHRERSFVFIRANSITAFKGYELPQFQSQKRMDPKICQYCNETFSSRNTKSYHVVGRKDKNKPPACPIVLMINKIRRISEYWEECTVELVNYQNRTMLIRELDGLFNKLQKHNKLLDKIIESEHCDERFEKDIVDLENKLYSIKTFLSLWIDVQRKWVYPEGFFSGRADIATLLPIELNRFFGVSTEFFAFMDRIVKWPQIMNILEMIELESAKNLLKELSCIEKKIQELDHDVEMQLC